MVRTISNNMNEGETLNDESNGGMKKGPWTPAEDAILIEYVKKYGEGNWNTVQKNSGLSRCGKSCRLRWANHLRPNLKKGAFSAEEEKIIIDLHAKLGNKWARMAAQLPGRTDNEIKNFWNTRYKRRQRAGLPIYPPEVHAEAIAFQNLQRRFLEHQQQPSSFSLLLSSCYPPKKLNDPNQNLVSNANNPLQSNPDCYANPSQQFNFPNENSTNNAATLALPLSPYASSSSTLFNQTFAPPTCSATIDSIGFIAGSPYEVAPLSPFPNLVPGSTTDISSSQTPTPASSYASGVDGFMGPASSIVNNNNDFYEVAPLSPPHQGNTNSGLLDALVMEARTLSRNDKSNSDEDSTLAHPKASHKRKSMADDHEYAEEASKKKSVNTSTNENQPPQLSKGKNVVGDEGPLEELNCMDDDLFSLLNHFPSEMPMPEWYRRGESESLGLETEPEASSPDQEFAWSLGPRWNNLRGIC